eukprot:NODE_2681_length_1363_cov_152.507258_g2547_i0.p1 GENE.NODE_2681_length_1363_cov_152.507258_g2547_i0~~NODE_2681_length_1363_cov_152.507258_g2547_i0.p1  ORF type:complete len:396 (-),score=53.01 NODE_2681_length_1363_cov_152.507258_g2547_i0:122-1309(-)
MASLTVSTEAAVDLAVPAPPVDVAAVAATPAPTESPVPAVAAPAEVADGIKVDAPVDSPLASSAAPEETVAPSPIVPPDDVDSSVPAGDQLSAAGSQTTSSEPQEPVNNTVDSPRVRTSAASASKRKSKKQQVQWDDAAWTVRLDSTLRSLMLQRQHGVSTSSQGLHQLCSKEIMPVFVSRLTKYIPLEPTDAFWDLGCGIGNVVAQVALQRRCPSYGVELTGHNLAIAKKVWEKIDAETSDPHGTCDFVEGDMTKLKDFYITTWAHNPSRVLFWISNYLFPIELNHDILEMLSDIAPVGAVICTLKPLYPVTRSVRGFEQYADRFNLQVVSYPSHFVEWGKAGTVYVYTFKESTTLKKLPKTLGPERADPKKRKAPSSTPAGPGPAKRTRSQAM